MRAGTNPNSRPEHEQRGQGIRRTASPVRTAAGKGAQKIAAARRLTEDFLYEVIQRLLPFCGIMSVTCHVPDVRDFFLLQVGVNPLADADESVFAAAREARAV